MKLNAKVLAISLVTLLFAAGVAFAADAAKGQQYLNYGHQFFKQKQYDKAIQYYAYSAKINPDASAYYYTGLAYYYKGDKAQALRFAQYALKLNPALAAAKKLVAASGGGAATGSVTAAGTTGVDKYIAAGNQFLKVKQYDKAIQYYQASINMNPTWQGYAYLGTANYYKGDMTNAKASYTKSLELNPNNPGVRQVVAKIDAAGGSATPAEPRLGQQMGVNPLLLALLFAGAIAVLFVF